MRNVLLGLLCMLGVSTAVFSETKYDVSFEKAKIQTSPESISVDVGPGTYYNYYYGKSWLMHFSGTSFIEVSFDKASDANGQTLLYMKHLASQVNGDWYSPITISINGDDFIERYNPNEKRSGWHEDTFDITDFIVEGRNTIRIHLDWDAIGNYWINKLAISFEN